MLEKHGGLKGLDAGGYVANEVSAAAVPTSEATIEAQKAAFGRVVEGDS